MPSIVAKFGGSSLSCAEQFKKVKKILSMNEKRRFVVPSAPGKRFAGDTKITDLLIKCYEMNANSENIDDIFSVIYKRYTEIKKDLNLKVDIEKELEIVKSNILNGESRDYVASRGEYLCGKLLADYLGFEFVDPTQGIYFFENGNYDSELSNRILAELLSSKKNVVIPGFYGRKQDGSIQTFSRGGSDITGAVVARAICAELYENWTDVSGFLMADPNIVDNPLEIYELSYKELRELCYMGANVLHEDAIYPVQRARISTNIRNTNFPDHPGTLIVHSSNDPKPRKTLITGIAGKTGFSIINIEKSMMNTQIGFAMRVLQSLYELNISFEHLPSGIDSICVVVNQSELEGKEEALLNRIEELVHPDTINVKKDIAMLSVVGRGMIHHYGTASRIFKALSDKEINIRLIDQGTSELSIIIGIDKLRFEEAIRAIYKEFVN